MASLLAGGREVLWGSNLFWHSMSHMGSALCQWRLLPGGLHHGRLRNADMASLLAGGREVLWGSNLCWHSMSHMGSALCQWRLLPGDCIEKVRIPLPKVDATCLVPGRREVLWGKQCLFVQHEPYDFINDILVQKSRLQRR